MMTISKRTGGKMNKAVVTYVKKINAKILALSLALVVMCAGMNAYAFDWEKDGPVSAGKQKYDWGTGAYLPETKSSCEGPQTCLPEGPSNRFTVECPDKSIARRDILVDCLHKLNENNSNCINTIPTVNIDRVSEDICYRRKGWGKERNHEGMDYASTTGSPVFAAAAGVVKHTSTGGSGYGRYIEIQHQRTESSNPNSIVDLPKNKTFLTKYAHLSQILVSSGQKVDKGEKIGLVGTSGASGDGSYPPHLHFEIRDGNNRVLDPMCNNIQSLCGVCSKDFTPSKCRSDCKAGSTEPHCNPPTGYGLFNYNTGAAGQSDINYTGTGAGAGGSGGGRSLGTKECNIDSYRKSFSKCVFCDLFRILFDVASIIAAKAYAALAAGVTSVVIVGMALWLAFTIIKFISSMEVKDPRILVKTILNQSFVVLIVVVLLKYDMKELMNIALSPIFDTGMKLAQMVTSGGVQQACDGFTKVTDQGGIPESMGNNILCTIMSVQGEILDVMTLGSTSLCVGFFVESWKGIPIFPHLGYVIVGLILWIAAFLLLVIYPFLLVDSILQLSVATALLPAAIGTYAFPITRKKYLSKVWETFMNAMFTFLFLSIVIFIITSAVHSIVGETMDRMKNVGTGDSSYSMILDVVNGLAWWGVKFLELVFVMFLGWAVLDEAKSFAGSFTKGGFKLSENIGSNVGTTAMSGVQGVAAPVAKGALHLASEGGSAIGKTIHEKAHAAKVNFSANRIKNNKNSIVDQDGNMTLTTRNWRGQKVTKTLTAGASGNQMITRTKGNVTTQTDKFMTVTTKKDKKGNVLSQQVKMEAAGAKSLLNKDGTLNMVAINAIRQNSQHSPDVVNAAIMNQVLKERMPGFEGANMDNSFASRQIVSSDPNNFEIKQVNSDGSITNFKMESRNGRMMTSVERVSKGGSARKYQSDGVINKKSSYNYVNGQIDQKSVKDKYAFNSYYTKFGSSPMDSNGNFSNGVKAEDIMFEQEDLDLMKEQIGLYGKPNSFTEFK